MKQTQLTQVISNFLTSYAAIYLLGLSTLVLPFTNIILLLSMGPGGSERTKRKF